jgi:hypothetical protein
VSADLLVIRFEMFSQRSFQHRSNVWNYKVPVMQSTLLTTMATSNAILSNTARRGGNDVCRQRTNLRLAAASSSAAHHTKSFNIPDELVEYIGPDSQMRFVGVETVRNATITIKVDPDLPWGDHYNTSPFLPGTAQRLVAEEAALLYGNADLCNIGGFFYCLYQEKDRVTLLKHSRIEALRFILHVSW